jgi:hypothetical protein
MKKRTESAVDTTLSATIDLKQVPRNKCQANDGWAQPKW